MKNLITIIIAVLISLTLKAEDCQNINEAFGANEHLKYKVYYNWKDVWVKAGFVTFDIEETSTNYHIKAVGKTYPFYNWIYKVHDVYETYVDKTTTLPDRFVRDVNEGGFKIDHEYNFNRELYKVHTVSKVNEDKTVIKDFDFNTCTHDMLSAIYKMRTIDFKTMKIGESVPVEVFLDNEFYDLSMKYKGKATVDTKFGIINCIKVQPMVVSGRVFEEEDGISIYVTDDENKIPVLIETPISVGVVKVILEEFENLKNPTLAIKK